MTYCPHCSTDSATLRWQAERIEELEVRLQEREEDLAAIRKGTTLVPDEALTKLEGQVFRLLLAKDCVTTPAIFAAMEHAKGGTDLNMVSVIVCRLRKKIAPLGLEIKNRWGQGYYIPRGQKAALTNLQPAAVNQSEWAHEPNAKSAAER